jgi:flavorubredoxin
VTTVSEIAPDVYRISMFVPDAGIQFSQFLVVDEEPLLYETGFKAMFPLVREAVAQIIDPSSIRHISFSHFEGDECGSLNEWLEIAPNSQALCSFVGSITSVQDFAIREPRAMQHDETFSTGTKRFRFRQTPHVPHCWDAGLMFEETTGTLFASDLFFHDGDPEPLTQSDVVERSVKALSNFKAGPMAVPIPYTLDTERIIHGLADLEPRVIAAHHGSCFEGDGGRALRDLASAIKDFGRLVEGGDPLAQPGPVEGAPDAAVLDEPIEDEVAGA